MALRVRAVVPTLWRSPVLVDCLTALRREEERTPGVEVELVVVAQDNRKEKFRHQEPRVRELAHLENLPKASGFSVATNRGIAALETPVDYVATVNDDAVVQEGWLGALVNALEANPEAGSAQGWNLGGEGRRIDGIGIGWNKPLQAIQIGHGKKVKKIPQVQREVWGVSATAALYRLRMLDELDLSHGIFDERLDSYYEDVDLALRLREHRRTAWSIPEARVLHEGSCSSPSDYQVHHTYRNRHWVLARALGAAYEAERSRIERRDWRDQLSWDRGKVRSIREGLAEVPDRFDEFSASTTGRTTADELRAWPP